MKLLKLRWTFLLQILWTLAHIDSAKADFRSESEASWQKIFADVPTEPSLPRAGMFSRNPGFRIRFQPMGAIDYGGLFDSKSNAIYLAWHNLSSDTITTTAIHEWNHLQTHLSFLKVEKFIANLLRKKRIYNEQKLYESFKRHQNSMAIAFFKKKDQLQKEELLESSLLKKYYGKGYSSDEGKVRAKEARYMFSYFQKLLKRTDPLSVKNFNFVFKDLKQNIEDALEFHRTDFRIDKNRNDGWVSLGKFESIEENGSQF